MLEQKSHTLKMWVQKPNRWSKGEHGMGKLARATARGGGLKQQNGNWVSHLRRTLNTKGVPISILDPVDALVAMPTTTSGPRKKIHGPKGVTVAGRPVRCGGVLHPMSTWPRNTEQRMALCAPHASRTLSLN